MKNNLSWDDICILGAGPAGLSTSIHLSMKGIKHTLIDKVSFPREKACSDVIPSVVLRFLKEMAPEMLSDLEKEGKIFPVDGISLSSSSHHGIQFELPALDGIEGEVSCYSIKRADFDTALLKRARSFEENRFFAPVDISEFIKTPEGWILHNRDGSFLIKPRLLILATGSNFLHNYKLVKTDRSEKDYFVGLRAYFSNVKPALKNTYTEYYILKNDCPGIIIITHLGNDEVNVNMACSEFMLRKTKQSIHTIFENAIRTHPAFIERFKDSKMKSPMKGSRLFLGCRNRNIVSDHVMMVGDAAGLLDVLSSNGIPQAVRSGKIAAESIEKFISKDDYSAQVLKEYEKALYKKLLNDSRTQLLLHRAVMSKWGYKTANVLLDLFLKSGILERQANQLMSKKSVASIFRDPGFYLRLFHLKK
jgi:flavin-dependent dehydrogenase